MVSEVDRAKRALVTLLRRLAAIHVLTLDVSRESSDGDLRTAYRKLSRKIHPDRKGRPRADIGTERQRDKETKRQGDRESKHKVAQHGI